MTRLHAALQINRGSNTGRIKIHVSAPKCPNPASYPMLQGTHSPAEMRPEREADSLHPSSAKMKVMPPIRLSGVHREIFSYPLHVLVRFPLQGKGKCPV